MNPVKLGAIALTLIIACPLVLGYALASDDEEVERDVVESTSNISDMIINSTSDYYMDYSGADNNSYLINDIGGVITPDYITTGSNPTSMPVYTTNSTGGVFDYTGTDGNTSSIASESEITQSNTVNTYTWAEALQMSGSQISGVARFPSAWQSEIVLNLPTVPINALTFTTVTSTTLTHNLICMTSAESYEDWINGDYTTPEEVISLSASTEYHVVLMQTAIADTSDSGYPEFSVYVLDTNDTIINTVDGVIGFYTEFDESDSTSTQTISLEVTDITGNTFTTPAILEIPHYQQIDGYGNTTDIYKNGGYSFFYDSTYTVYAPDTSVRYVLVNPGICITTYDGSMNVISTITGVGDSVTFSYIESYNYTRNGDTDAYVFSTQLPVSSTITAASLDYIGLIIPVFASSDASNMYWMDVTLTGTSTDVTETVTDCYEWYNHNNLRLAKNSDGTMTCRYWDVSSDAYVTYTDLTSVTVTAFGTEGCGLTTKTSIPSESFMPNANGVWEVNFGSRFLSIEVVHDDGTTAMNGYAGDTSPSTLFYSKGTLTTDLGTFTGVTAINFRALFSATITYYTITYTATSTYIDPADGWKIPMSNALIPSPYDVTWFNTYSNNYIRMMMKVSESPVDGIEYGFSLIDEDDDLMTIHQDSTGLTSVEFGDTTTTLGNYNYLMIEFNVRDSQVVVSGLRVWDTFGVYPTVYNQVVISHDFSGDISMIGISPSGMSNQNRAHFRVDSASIIGGTFPSTENFALRLWDLYPDCEHEMIYFNSIGVYGDYFTIGGVPQTISNGQITLTDADTSESFTASLLGIRIDMVDSEEWGEYVTYVNGHRVANSDSAPEIVFVGEWSLTLTRSEITTETATVSSWTPGEFALDENGFVLAMVLTAVAVFVVLGMTGSRSGAKVGLLALICGGACAVGLIII